MASVTELSIEVVYADSARQVVRVVTLPAGSTVGDAVRASGLLNELPQDASGREAFGVYGERVEAQTPLQPGDRVEIYRPLRADPRETRRRRATRKPRN